MCIFSIFNRKKNILKWKRTDIDSKQSVDIGDANSPDAPWMKDKK